MHEPRTASISLLRTSRSSGLSGGGSLNDSKENEMTHRRSLKVLLVGFFVLLASASVAWGEIDAELLNKAKAGDAFSQYRLGLMYANGIDVAEDYVEAVKWYRRAAEQGFAKAQFHLGKMYENGEGVAEDDVEAGKWFRKAAAQGLQNATEHLRRLESAVEQVARNKQEAERLAEERQARNKQKEERLAKKRQERRDACRLGLQADQREFVRALGNMAIRYDKEVNEIRKSGIYNEAREYSENFFNVRGRTIKNWGAKLFDLRTSKGGHRASVHLSINFPTQGGGLFLEKVHFLNSGIRPGSSIYTSLEKMNEGDRVVFSATDISTEDSITERGAMKNPEYESKLTNIYSCSNYN
jgi:hypothetical protein